MKLSFISRVLCSVFIAHSLQFAVAAADEISAAEKLFLESKYDKAAQECDKLIKSGSSRQDEILYIKGLSELRSNKFAGARGSFGSVVSNYPRSKRAFDARVGIGDSYFLEGNKQAASSIYADVIEKFPDDTNIGIVRSRLKDCGSPQGVINSVPPVKEVVLTAPAVPAYNFTAKGACPSDGTGTISIQVGCFKSRRNAENLSNKLKKEGYISYVEIPIDRKDNLYRVKVGRFTSMAEAQNKAAKLKVRGYNTKICGS